MLKYLFKKMLSEYRYYRVMYWVDTIKRKKTTYLYPYILKGGKKNPDKRFYVFRYDMPAYGILAVARTMPDNIEWAIKNNYIPVVAYERRWNLEKKILNHNYWEDFFEQPGGYSLQEVLESKHVMMGKIREVKETSKSYISEDFERYFKGDSFLYHNSLKLKENIEKTYLSYYTELFKGKSKILGVSLREGFQIHASVGNKHATNHPRSIDVDEAIQYTKIYKDKFKCDYVFLTTAYEESVESFKKEFGNCLLYTNRSRFRMIEHGEKLKLLDEKCDILSFELYQEDYNFWKENSQFDVTGNSSIILDYLKEVYGLAKCDYLLTDQSSAVMAAEIWNNKQYKEVCFFLKKHTSKLY